VYCTLVSGICNSLELLLRVFHIVLSNAGMNRPLAVYTAAHVRYVIAPSSRWSTTRI